MYGYIYKTTNLINGKIYIGQKKSKEFVESYKGSGRYLKNALNKYGESNFKVEIIEWCNTFEDLNNREKYWISYFEDKNYDMYNIAKGAVGGDTYHGLSEEDRKQRIENLKKNGYFSVESEIAKKDRIQKIVETRKRKGNYVISQEQKEYLSLINKGKKLSSETIKKMTDNRKGYKHTEETKRKISQGNKGKKKTVESIEKLSKNLKEYYKTHDNPFKNKTHSEETKKKISEKCKGITLNTIWVNNGNENKRIKESELSDYENKGYIKGRIKFDNKAYKRKGKPLSKDHRNKISKALFGEHNGFYGKHLSEENKKKMLEGIKKKLIGTVRVGKNGEYKYIKPEEINEYLNQGFELSERGKQVYGKK